MAQTGSLSPKTRGAAAATFSSPGGSIDKLWPGAFGIVRLNAAEKGLDIVRVASCSSEIEAKPWRYHPMPTGPTNRIKSVRYVITSATDVRRAREEHSNPIVALARQVV